MSAGSFIENVHARAKELGFEVVVVPLPPLPGCRICRAGIGPWNVCSVAKDLPPIKVIIVSAITLCSICMKSEEAHGRALKMVIDMYHLKHGEGK